MLLLPKPEKCPKCSEAAILRILYGQPVSEKVAMVERGEAVLGGCVIGPGEMPDWRCRNCGYVWRDGADLVEE